MQDASSAPGSPAHFAGLHNAETSPAPRGVTANAAAATVDLTGRVLRAGARFREIVDRTEQELTSTTLTALTHPEDRPRETELVQQLLDGHVPAFVIEKRFITPSGESVWVRNSTTLVHDERGRPFRMVTIVEELEGLMRERSLLTGQTRILAHLAAGKPLTELLEEIATMIEGHSNGMLASILVLDEDGRHLRHGAAPSLPEGYNRGIDGVEVGEAVGSCGTAAYRGEPVFVTDIEIDPLWDSYRELAREHDLRSCWSTPIRSTQGGLLGTFALYYRKPRFPTEGDRDIIRVATHLAGVAIERARADARVRQLTDSLERRVEARTRQLAQANRDLEKFGYTVAHDLRAPLRGVRTLAEYMLEDYADHLDDEGRSRLESIVTSCGRMSDLIHDILNLSLTTREPPQLADVDVTALVDELADEMRRRQPEHDVDFVAKDGMHVIADPRLLRIAFENLLSNAWKFTRDTPDARVEVSLARHPREAVLTVRDNGAGFDPANLDRLFEPFQRLHGSSRFEGTGIGLATVRRVAEHHDGRVWAEGKPGEGAAFHLALPDEGAE